MSAIDDIINAATPGPWDRYPNRLTTADTVVDFADRGLCDVRCDGSPVGMRYATTRFIATFDPEHIRLMEDVCAAWKVFGHEDDRYDEMEFEDALALDSKQRDALYAATDALDAYRKERGYE